MSPHRLAILTSALLFAAAATAPAQPENPSPRLEPVASLIDDLPPDARAAQRERAAADQAENLQILATIVREDVMGLFGLDPQVESAHRSVAAPGPFGPALADYLPGYGVVVQMRSEAPANTPPPAAATAESPSRWEQTRRVLRGERVEKENPLTGICLQCHTNASDLDQQWQRLGIDFENTLQPLEKFMLQERLHGAHSDGWLHDQPKGAVSHRPTRNQIVAGLTRTIAEQGRHLTSLAGHERVSITVFYSMKDAAAASGQTGQSDGDGLGSVTALAFSPDGKRIVAEIGDGSENRMIMGDLLMRQKRYAQAAAAYEDALLQMIPDLQEKIINKSAREDWKPQELGAFRKLLQAHVAAGETDEAVDLVIRLQGGDARNREQRQTLARRLYLDLTGQVPTQEELDRFVNDESEDAMERLVDWLLNRPVGAARPVAPGRISVSATKSQIDRHAEGKLTLEDFAGQVEVRVFDPVRGSAASSADRVKR